MSVKKPGPWKVLVGIFLGVLIGSATQPGTTLFGIDLFSYCHPIYKLCGKIFLNALTLVVVPLVASSIITGITRIGKEQNFGRLTVKIFTFYLGTSLLAIVIGMIFANIYQPGSAINPDTLYANQMGIDHHSALKESTARFSDLILQLVPSNIVDALGKGQMLGIIFFSLLFGYCLTRIEKPSATILTRFFQGIFHAMIEITHLIMKILPIGVFFLVAQVFAESGLRSLTSLGLFTLCVLSALATFMFIGLPLLLKWIGKIEPIRLFKAMAPALVTAFSTSSSSASLPVTIDCVEKRAGVSNKICSLVVPLGTSVNMSGSALYECVAALFVAQVYGLDLSLFTQFSVLLLSLVMSLGVAGIPSGSLVALIVILKTMGLPLEGIGLIIAVDRILDMCRTTVNVFSDSCCAVLIAKLEGEKEVLSKAYISEEV